LEDLPSFVSQAVLSQTLIEATSQILLGVQESTLSSISPLANQVNALHHAVEQLETKMSDIMATRMDSSEDVGASGPPLPPPAEIVAALASSGFHAASRSLITAGLRIARAKDFVKITDCTIEKITSQYGSRPGWTTLASLVGVPLCDLDLLVAAVASIDGRSKPEDAKHDTKEEKEDNEEELQFTLGTRVTAHGLLGAPELNNMNGTIVVWNKEKRRVGVKFDRDGLEKLLKPDNLEHEATPG